MWTLVSASTCGLSPKACSCCSLCLSSFCSLNICVCLKLLVIFIFLSLFTLSLSFCGLVSSSLNDRSPPSSDDRGAPTGSQIQQTQIQALTLSPSLCLSVPPSVSLSLPCGFLPVCLSLSSGEQTSQVFLPSSSWAVPCFN